MPRSPMLTSSSSSSLMLLWFLWLCGHTAVVFACTDILVTPGASADGSSMIAYNADSPTLYGTIYHYPATSQKAASSLQDDATMMRQVYDWDSGVYLGEIPEAAETYNVVGNMNEHGLVIGESTFGGVAILAHNQTGAIIDYGSLIWITLQRAKTAREAIHTMVELMDTYGYASGGESFSITDRTGEVWMMEVIGRGSSYAPPLDGSNGGTGDFVKGAVWVAIRIPDGMVAAHANHARITTFPRDDPDNCLFAPDVVDVAVHYGLYPADADPLQFSFSDVYDPLDFVGARQGEARVWSIFSQITESSFEPHYQAYATGIDLQHRMPLYVKPVQKLTVKDVMHLLTSHYEGTILDGSIDVGAGLFASPYRPRPLVWTLDGENGEPQTFHNERTVATAKTGWSFVAQVRSWMPPELAAVAWYAMDDSSTAPRVPVYGSSRTIAPPYAGKGAQDGVVTPLLQFDWNKAFWVQNMVSNFCYSRWQDLYPVVRQKIDDIQDDLSRKLALVDQNALQLYHEKNAEAAIAYVTQFGVNSGIKLHQVWFAFYGELFVKYRDYYTIVPLPEEPVCNCQANEPGLSQVVKRRIVQETGNHYRVIDKDSDHPDVIYGEYWKDRMPLLSLERSATTPKPKKNELPTLTQ